ncbi:hypothetical protein CEXT_129111 [Caerostris extrusa]|uniref:Secreted protein n=1 Tax=Caerostris extrusa TaxID=172846 RepID=A0AAV4UEN3_CAEEX|nr:hypothetical protein CEXT_129111 [Caerostris extrusa]
MLWMLAVFFVKGGHLLQQQPLRGAAVVSHIPSKTMLGGLGIDHWPVLYYQIPVCGLPFHGPPLHPFLVSNEADDFGQNESKFLLGKLFLAKGLELNGTKSSSDILLCPRRLDSWDFCEW